MPARSEVLAFLSAIKANPEDDAPRLMLADWLTEHGDPRGEFVRCQVMLATLPPDAPACLALMDRIDALYKLHTAEWTGLWGDAIPTLQFTRGTMRITLDWDNVSTFLKRWKRSGSEEVFAWINGVYLDRIGERRANEFIRSGFLEQLNHLSLWIDGSSVSCAESLSKQLDLTHLASLKIAGSQLGDAGSAHLARAKSLTGLRTLVLGRNEITDAGVAAIVGSPWANELRELELYTNAITATGVRALAQSPILANLTALDLYQNAIGDRGAGELSRAAFLPKLRRLHLGRTALTSSGLVELLTDKPLPALAELHLGDNAIDDQGIIALAGSPYLPALRTLKLPNNRLTNSGAMELARSPYLQQLTLLHLGGNAIHTKAEKALRKRFGDGLSL